MITVRKACFSASVFTFGGMNKYVWLNTVLKH
jgi:hypothetical protein